MIFLIIQHSGTIYKDLETTRPFKTNRNQRELRFADLQQAPTQKLQIQRWLRTNPVLTWIGLQVVPCTGHSHKAKHQQQELDLHFLEETESKFKCDLLVSKKNHTEGPCSPLCCSRFQAHIQRLGCVLFGLCNSLNTRHFAIKCLFTDRAHRMEPLHFVFEQRSDRAEQCLLFRFTPI